MAILGACAFFSQVEGASRTRLIRMAVRREYQKGETIFREGDPAPGVFVVGSGLVRVFKLAPSGKEHVLHLAGPGMTFAEVAVLGNFPCPAFAETLEDSSCLLLPVEPFMRALREDHQLSLQILSSMAMCVKSLVSLLEDIVLRDAVGRVAGYLLQTQAEHGSAVSLSGLKRHIASHLNLTSETLSRSLRQLREENLIRESDGSLLVLDTPALKRIAEGYYPRL